MTGDLVLSLFPGIGILDRGFEEEGFCIVRGPDLLWGGDIKGFHPPPGVFGGVIGGPPCQAHSSLKHLLKHQGRELAEDLIPEFERVVRETMPAWFVMENVVTAPLPAIEGYCIDPAVLNDRWLGEEQSRKHRFSFGTRDSRRLVWDGLAALENPAWQPRIMASGQIGNMHGEGRRNMHGEGRRNMHKVRRSRQHLREALRLQGLPEDFLDHAPFTVKASMQVIGNAVALPMARCLARAVRQALEREAAA